MRSPKLQLEVFLVSLAVLLLEVSYTRVFSFKLVYYFTYLIIGISLLGLGSGGILIAMFPRVRRTPIARFLPPCAAFASLAVLVSYVVVARVQLNAFDLIQGVATGNAGVAVEEGRKLVAICVSLFLPFLAGGLALALIFSTHAERINWLYCADLIGAAAGCAACVPLMKTISPPGCVMVAGLAFALAGLPLALARTRALAAPLVVLAALLLAGAVLPRRLPAVVTDRVKTMSPQQTPDVVFSQWSPVFRVDVLERKDRKDWNNREGLILSHDGMWGSVLPRYDGDPASLARYDLDVRSYPFRMLPPHPRVAIIGAAGGNEILASLHFEAAHVTGVELNPVTVSLLTRHFADFTSHVVEDPRVTLVNAEGRSFLMSHPDRYDLIWFVAPDSYAAMNAATSGAYVLSESYLYTAEMIIESLTHLTPDGIVCVQFGEGAFDVKPNRTARYLNTAREAFRRLGVTDPEKHILVSTTPGFVFVTATILLKRDAFTEAEVARFVAHGETLQGTEIRHAWTRPAGTNPINRVLGLQGEALERWYREYPFDVRPITDDAPFFWHFVPFRDAIGSAATNPGGALEEGTGERLLLLLLVVATLFGAAFLLTPLLARRAIWRTIPYKLNAGVYFAALGLGFMFLEVTLIQHLTLFLGYPTYSLTVTLFALLISTGVGSLVSAGIGGNRNRVLLALAAVLVLLVVFYQVGMEPIVRACIGWPFPLRVALVIAFLAPLGLCLGVFMPLGLRTVSALTPYGEEYVAWAWAVNGFFSVVSSVLSTVLSMALGFDVVMLLALVVYGIGIAALWGVPAAASARTTS